MNVIISGKEMFLFRWIKSVLPVCVCVCVCLGERGRGYESSGTGRENPPFPRGGTPSPPTSPTSPSPTTLWGTSATPSPVSAMYVNNLSVGTKKPSRCWIFRLQIWLAPPEMWSRGQWAASFLFRGVLNYPSSATSLHERKTFTLLV